MFCFFCLPGSLPIFGPWPKLLTPTKFQENGFNSFAQFLWLTNKQSDIEQRTLSTVNEQIHCRVKWRSPWGGRPSISTTTSICPWFNFEWCGWLRTSTRTFLTWPWAQNTVSVVSVQDNCTLILLIMMSCWMLWGRSDSVEEGGREETRTDRDLTCLDFELLWQRAHTPLHLHLMSSCCQRLDNGEDVTLTLTPHGVCHWRDYVWGHRESRFTATDVRMKPCLKQQSTVPGCERLCALAGVRQPLYVSIHVWSFNERM